MGNDSQSDLVMILGRFGILPLCRNATITSINDAAKRSQGSGPGSIGQENSSIHSDLHESIEVRHSEEMEAQGAVMDQSEVIQYLNSDDNPVGKGKNDAALVIESAQFAENQRNLIETIWEEAIPFDIASKRYTEERITDPLKLTLNEGSFLEKIREVLMIERTFLRRTLLSISMHSWPRD